MMRRASYLREMELVQWVRADKVSAGVGRNLAENASAPARRVTEPAASALDQLAREVVACQKCELHRFRQQTVFGQGNVGADWMVVGEAPGAEEDKQGQPFVGRAGTLLTAMLASIGLSRDDVFIANVLKCRPPENRDPLGEEVRCCSPYLIQQIDLIRPKIILAMGRFAAQVLLETTEPIGQLRGKIHEWGVTKTPLIVTYHPAYLLRSPLAKTKSWSDLRSAIRHFRNEFKS